MRLGVTLFVTDRTIDPATLARESEARGFVSLYLPEHSHYPVEIGHALPKGQTELDEGYQRTLDPYVALAAASAVTESIALGTGVSLIAEHDPITLAKQIATLDHLSGGRVVLGIGFGWNRAEMSHHGIAFGERRAMTREYVLAMRALWSQDEAEFHGEHLDFAPSRAWPKPVHGAVPVLLGGDPGPKLFAAMAEYGDGWMPIGGAGIAKALPDLHAAFTAAGREPSEARVIPFGTIPSVEKLDYYRSLGIDEVVLRLPAAGRDEVLPVLDELTQFLDD